MPDTFGAVTVPLAGPASDAPVGDPCLGVILAYLKAFLNTYARKAWEAVAPLSLPVNGTLTADPTKHVFNERDLPALYLNRTGHAQPPVWWTADWLVAEDTLKLLWVFPQAAQERQNLRSTFINGVVKHVLVAIERERDACFALPGDSDPTAATLTALPTAIKLPVATSTAAQLYSGVTLDGAIGHGVISPPRPIVVTASGSPNSLAPGSHMVVRGTNALGLKQSVTLGVAGLGTFTTAAEFASVAEISIDSQIDSDGELSFGVGPYQGRGSVIRDFTNLMSWFVSKWKATTVVIPMSESQPRTYEALEVDITIREL